MCLENRWWQYLQQFLNNKTLHNEWLLLHVGSQIVQITPFTKEKRNLGNQMLSTFNWEKKVLEMIYNFSKKPSLYHLFYCCLSQETEWKWSSFHPIFPHVRVIKHVLLRFSYFTSNTLPAPVHTISLFALSQVYGMNALCYAHLSDIDKTQFN